MNDQQDIDQVAEALRLAGAMRQADSRRLVSGQPTLSRDRVASQLQAANERHYLHKQQESLLETQRLVRKQVEATSRLSDLVERLVRQRTRRPVHKVQDSEKRRIEPIGGFTKPAPVAGGGYSFWDSVMANSLANSFTKGGLLGKIAGGLAGALGLKKLVGLLGGLVRGAKVTATTGAAGLAGRAAGAARGLVAKIQQAPKAAVAKVAKAATTPLMAAQKAATGAVQAVSGAVAGAATAAKGAKAAVSGALGATAKAASPLVAKIPHVLKGAKLPLGLGLLAAGADLAHNEATKQGDDRRVGRWRIAGEHGGAMAGGAAGVKAGAALGTMVAPGLGTLVGAGLGGLLGAVGGGALGSRLATAFATPSLSKAAGPSHLAGGQLAATGTARPVNPELSFVNKSLEEVAGNTRPLADGKLAEALRQALWPLTNAITQAFGWLRQSLGLSSQSQQPSPFTGASGGGAYSGAGASGQWSATPTHSPYVERNAGASEVVAGGFADTVGRHESGARGYNAYNRGNVGQGREHIDLSSMTIQQILDHQSRRKGDPTRLGAVGKYQVIGSTLRGAVKALKLDPNTRFTPEVQDLIFTDYLTTAKKGRGAIDAYITGRSDNLNAAVDAVASEWAAFKASGGRGKYDGLAGNKGTAHSQKVLMYTRNLYQKNVAAGVEPKEALRRAKLGKGPGTAKKAASAPAPRATATSPVATTSAGGGGGASGSWGSSVSSTGGASGSWESPAPASINVTTRSLRQDSPQATTVKTPQTPVAQEGSQQELVAEIRGLRKDLAQTLTQVRGGNRDLPSLSNTPAWPQDPMLGMVLNGTF